MAITDSTASKSGDEGAELKVYEGGIKEVRRRSTWILCGNVPKCVDDLTFTGRDENGRWLWWMVTPPQTDYRPVHEMLGRAHAFELLDLINNPEAEYPEVILAYITDSMMRWRLTVTPCAGEGTVYGFFNVIGEYLATGKVDR